ncbi:MAG TPA: hypothetical protein VMU69_03925 [Bradyrhizobium sp.]|nr:hypothetical protein [Bradyrhizobium sp.]
MTLRQMRMPEKKIENVETEAAEYFSQRKRPELGRFLLQVDRQTKGSYETAETAKSAALAIKKGYPLLHVTVYDTLESATSII